MPVLRHCSAESGDPSKAAASTIRLEGKGGDHITSANDQDWPIETGINGLPSQARARLRRRAIALHVVKAWPTELHRRVACPLQYS